MRFTLNRLSGTNTRRGFLQGTLAALVASASGFTSAALDEHGHHHHTRNTDLVDAATHCIKTGQLCRDHCIERIKNGDSTMIDCLDAVTDTISMCKTLMQLTVSGSPHLKAFAKVCKDVCKDCEDQCRKHKKHQACKDCMESCIACIKEIDKLLA